MGRGVGNFQQGTARRGGEYIVTMLKRQFTYIHTYRVMLSSMIRMIATHQCHYRSYHRRRCRRIPLIIPTEVVSIPPPLIWISLRKTAMIMIVARFFANKNYSSKTYLNVLFLLIRSRIVLTRDGVSVFPHSPKTIQVTTTPHF